MHVVTTEGSGLLNLILRLLHSFFINGKNVVFFEETFFLEITYVTTLQRKLILMLAQKQLYQRFIR